MNCPKCGKENPEDAQLCQSCSCELTQSTVTAENVIIKTSGIGIASMVLGILSVFTFGITAIPAVILGIISLVQIEKSGGKLTGRAFGIVGIAVPVVVCFLGIGLLMPALNKAHELGRRTVCLGNMKQLSLAWVMYADENDGDLVNGEAGNWNRLIPNPTPPPTDICGEPPWVSDIPLQNGNPTIDKRSQEQIIRNGALWEYAKNPKVFRCPAGKVNHLLTYQIVDSMNGFQQPDTVADGVWANKKGELSRPGDKIVFIDIGEVRSSSYHVSYRDTKWLDMPPVRHRDGANLSFADAHAVYWKWKGKGTVDAGKKRTPDYTPVPGSVDDMQDLRDMQIAVWGKIP
ncbi:MAG: DUF4190 domain-containing protein [Planctomycetota bacterium]